MPTGHVPPTKALLWLALGLSGLTVMLLFGLVLAFGSGQAFELVDVEDRLYDPQRTPDRVVLTWQTNPATSQAVTWRTAATVGRGVVEIAQATPDPSFSETSWNAPARTTLVKTKSGSARYHSVNLTGLKPATTYAYRVGDGQEWSEWHHFRTASKYPEPFSFLYFGDAQSKIHSLWSRTIRAAYRAAPDARFMIHAGDLVHQRGGDHDAEWGEWFAAGQWIYGMVPTIPAAGNHDYLQDWRDRYTGLAQQWEVQFALPNHGPDELARSVYFVDYQGVRIIVLDSNHAIHFASAARQAVWLEQVLERNPQQWTIVVFHHPLFPLSAGRHAPLALHEHWKPLFDWYNVDLILNGHDHAYGRRSGFGQDSSPPPDGRVGPIYIVSISGPRMYDVAEPSITEMDRTAEDVQLFQILTVAGDRLRFEARGVTGELFDDFELVRQPGGGNHLVEGLVPASPRD